jgi:hypothetical protein
MQPHTTSPFQQSLLNPWVSSLLSATSLATRWQPDPLAARHLRELKQKQIGPKLPPSRRVHKDKQTRLSNHEPSHHEGHRQTVARHCPVAVGHR